MCKVVPKEGPRAPLFYSGIVLLLAAGASSGQDVRRSDLERCAELSTAALKLDCFESLTAVGEDPATSAEVASDPNQELSNKPAAQQETVVEENASPAAESLSQGVIAETGVSSVAEPATDVAESRSIETATGESAVPVPARSTEVPVAAPAAAGSAVRSTTGVADTGSGQAEIPDDFGKEHLGVPEEEKVEEVPVRATVIDVEQGRNKVLYFTFDNGQVWRQIEGRRFSYPRNEDFEVVINTGLMGDYRLRLAKGGPMTRIRRVQ